MPFASSGPSQQLMKRLFAKSSGDDGDFSGKVILNTTTLTPWYGTVGDITSYMATLWHSSSWYAAFRWGCCLDGRPPQGQSRHVRY